MKKTPMMLSVAAALAVAGVTPTVARDFADPIVQPAQAAIRASVSWRRAYPPVHRRVEEARDAVGTPNGRSSEHAAIGRLGPWSQARADVRREKLRRSMDFSTLTG